METVGWAAAAVVFIGGVVWVLSYALDQVPLVSRKLIRALRAVRQVRDEVRGLKRANEQRRELNRTST